MIIRRRTINHKLSLKFLLKKQGNKQEGASGGLLRFIVELERETRRAAMSQKAAENTQA